MTAESPSEEGVRKPERTVDRPDELYAKVIAGRFDQLSKHVDPGFAVVGFVGADHRLGDAGAPGQFHL